MAWRCAACWFPLPLRPLVISAGMGRNRKRVGSTTSSLAGSTTSSHTGNTTSSPYRVKRIQEREYIEKKEKENHAPPVVPAPLDTVVIKSPLCMAAFSLLEKLYNVPLKMSLVMGVWFIMGRVPFEKQFPWFAGLLWNNKNHSCMSVVFDCCFPLWSCSALLPVKWPFRTSNTWYIYISISHFAWRNQFFAKLARLPIISGHIANFTSRKMGGVIDPFFDIWGVFSPILGEETPQNAWSEKNSLCLCVVSRAAFHSRWFPLAWSSSIYQTFGKLLWDPFCLFCPVQCKL